MSPERSIWPWFELGLPGPAPLRDIKRAYAARLKVIDRTDPAAFQALQQVFEAAKAQALPDAAFVDPADAGVARPSMAVIVNGGAAPPIRDRPAPEFAQPVDAISPVSVPETVPEPVPQPMPKPDHAVPPAPLAHTVPPDRPAPKSASARPSGGPTGDLDALYDSDPDRALTQFWQRFNAAIPEANSWKWDLAALDRLLSLRLRHVAPGINTRVEAHLFAALGTSLDWSRAVVSNRVAVLLESHFGWVSDGVRFRRLFGNRDAFPLVAHGLSQSLPRNGRAAADLARRPYRVMKGAILGLVLLISVWAMRRSPGAQADLPEALVSGAIIGAILFVIAYYVLMVLLAFVRVPIVAMGLDQPLLRLARRIAPGVVSDLERSGQTRSLWYWGLCAMAVALVMVLPYL